LNPRPLGYEKSAPCLTLSRTSCHMSVYQRRSRKTVSLRLGLAGVWQPISVTGLVTESGLEPNSRVSPKMDDADEGYSLIP
jgi:hypothetical protein